MNEQERRDESARDYGATPGESYRGEKNEKHSLKQAVGEASDAIASEARSLGAEAMNAATQQADRAKGAATSHMDAFADALNAASQELGRNQSGPAADLVANAASGLESLSRSLHGKSTGEMVDTVRRFGRENPIGFIAGSVLAGFALGRFAAAAAPSTSAQAGASDTSRGSAAFAGGGAAPAAKAAAVSTGGMTSPGSGGTSHDAR